MDDELTPEEFHHECPAESLLGFLMANAPDQWEIDVLTPHHVAITWDTAEGERVSILLGAVNIDPKPPESEMPVIIDTGDLALGDML